MDLAPRAFELFQKFDKWPSHIGYFWHDGKILKETETLCSPKSHAMCFQWVFRISLKKSGPKNPFFRACTQQHQSYQDLRGPNSTIPVILGYISFGQKYRRDCGGPVYFEDQLRAILKIWWEIPIGKYGQKYRKIIVKNWAIFENYYGLSSEGLQIFSKILKGPLTYRVFLTWW